MQTGRLNHWVLTPEKLITATCGNRNSVSHAEGMSPCLQAWRNSGRRAGFITNLPRTCRLGGLLPPDNMSVCFSQMESCLLAVFLSLDFVCCFFNDRFPKKKKNAPDYKHVSLKSVPSDRSEMVKWNLPRGIHAPVVLSCWSLRTRIFFLLMKSQRKFITQKLKR